MIPLAVPNLSGNEARYLQECVDTTFVSSVGPFVDRMEEMICTASDASHCVVTSAGTTALHSALMALGVGPGDLVIVPSYTFVASPNAVSHCGAKPWFMDVDRESWTLDANVLANALERETEIRSGKIVHRITGQRVAAIMAVYTMGLPADMDEVVSIARRFDLPVVADAAAALGCTYKGRSTGEMGANLTVFSFNGNKTITAGGGGAVVGHDVALLDLVKHITTTARVGNGYDHDRVGYNYRMTNLQAAVGCAQMEQLDTFLLAKRRIAQRYNEAFADLPSVGLFPVPRWGDSACWFSGVTISPPLARVSEMVERLRNKSIATRTFWKPMHMLTVYKDCLATPMPVCEAMWESVLTLPCSTNLSESDQDHVILSFRELIESQL